MMTKKQIISICAMCILMALCIPAVSAEPCSFCEFINISNITRGVTDHSLLTNLSADDHPQYILANGTRSFTGKQSLGGFNLTDLLDPVAAQDAATKNYVDLVNTSMQAYVDANPPVTDHGLLSNLSGDGHLQYILTTGTRAFTGMQSLGGFNLTDLLDPVAPQDAATKNYVDTVNTSMQAYVDANPPVTDHGLLSNLSGDGHLQYILTAGTRAFTGMQSMGGYNLTDLLDPVAPQDAATKNYVDLVNVSQTAYTNTEISLANTSMKNYVDAANSSMKTYVDTADATKTTLAAVYPVGSIYISTVPTNPATTFGFGTWAAISTGRVLIGIDASNTQFDAVRETGGSNITSDVVQHSHPITITDPGHAHTERLNTVNSGALVGATYDASTNTAGNTGYTTAANSTGITASSSNPSGSVASMSLMNPYYVVYIWERTA